MSLNSKQGDINEINWMLIMVGSMKRTNFISMDKPLSIFSEQQLLKDQLFIFNGQLYEQTDGVVMGSPLGPLLASVFMCSIEERLEQEGKMPTYYRRFVDDTLTVMLLK